ncbi:MAG: alpha-amylase, partial [Cyclobacteriaceae bacterium]|nr:alpha-amylase [Cyclobacteriaceae bacterium]
PEVRKDAENIRSMTPDILRILKNIYKHKINVVKIRIHGDYNLEQILFTGKDFVITNFEGEPNRTYTERRLKRSPLRDVASMIRSFHSAAYANLLLDDQIPQEEIKKLMPVMERWHRFVSRIFLDAYIEAAAGTGFVPKSKEEMETLMTTFLLEKLLYELDYELRNRPEWVIIPLNGIKSILDHESRKESSAEVS